MIRVAVFNAHPHRRIRKGPVAGSVMRVLKGEGIRKADVAVIFVDARYCRRINKKYLSHDYSTDVISFPLGEEEGRKSVEGEIYVNLDKAREQARFYAVTEANEVTRLVVHGTLHLSGYDDYHRNAARRMRAQEERYLDLLVGGRPRKATGR
jgi:probable rRNA maturation factor